MPSSAAAGGANSRKLANMHVLINRVVIRTGWSSAGKGAARLLGISRDSGPRVKRSVVTIRGAAGRSALAETAA